MEAEQILLSVVTVLTVAGAVALRRHRARVPRWLWDVGELWPLVATYLGSFGGVLLFASLVGYRPGKLHEELAAASACLPALLVALCPRRYHARAAGVVVTLLTLLLLSDAIYFRFFGGIVPLLALGSAGSLWDIRDSIAALFEPTDLWLLLLVIIAGALLVLWPHAPPSQRPPRWRTALLWLLPLGALLLGSVPVKNDVEVYAAKSRSWKVFNIVDNLKWGGVITTHARDVATSLRERDLAAKLDAAQRTSVERYVEAHANEARGFEQLPSFGALRGNSVVMVQLEAIQQWLVDADVDGEPVMPFLRSLRERGLYFPNVYDQTGGSPTSDCEYLVLNGLHPLARGSVAFRRSSNDFVALPEVLAERGYQTLSAHAYLRGMWNRGMVHPKYGFEASYFRREIGVEPKLGWGMEDKAFFGRVVEILRGEQRPFFAFLITLTSHHPYRYVPSSVWKLNLEGTPKSLRGYLRSARYVDEAIEELFAGLEREGLLRETTVVLYGDHDAKLRFRKKHAAAAAKHMNVDATTLSHIGRRDASVDRVPLLIVPPLGSPLPAAVVPTVGGQIDIGATVLHYLGVRAPRSFLGLPLLAERSGEAARNDGVALDAKRIARPKGKGFSCAPAPGTAASEELSCDELRRRTDAQLQVSKTITLHDLAAELSTPQSQVDAGDVH